MFRARNLPLFVVHIMVLAQYALTYTRQAERAGEPTPGGCLHARCHPWR